MLEHASGSATLDEYLDRIEFALEFREYVDGRVRVVPPTSLEHALIIGRLAWSLDPIPRRSSCKVLLRGMLIRTAHSGNVFSPDVMSVCGTPQLESRGGTDFLLNPALLMEVVSPSGGEYELGEKWQNYRQLATLQEYVLIYEAAPRVVRYSRTGPQAWRIDEVAGLDSEIHLRSLDVTLRLAEIYEGVFTADTQSA